MFKGFSICFHVVATAHVNGDLRSFLDSVNGVCGPNLTAIANHDMPSGTGRKGGVAKRKRNRKLPAVETRSVRPCLESQQVNVAMVNPSSSSTGTNHPLRTIIFSTYCSSVGSYIYCISQTLVLLLLMAPLRVRLLLVHMLSILPPQHVCLLLTPHFPSNLQPAVTQRPRRNHLF